MKRTSTLLLAIAVGIAAEAEPATAPAQPAPAAPPPAAAAPAPADAVPAPAAETPPTGGQTTPSRRTGVRVARVAGDAPAWDGRLRVGAGWDSNALLESDPDNARTKTADYSGEATLGWRPVADDHDFVKATASYTYDRRPHLDNLDSSKLALGISGAHQGTTLTTGGSLSAARYWIDEEGAAAELRGGLSVGWLRQSSADLLAGEVALIHFEQAGELQPGADALVNLGRSDDRTGTLAAGAWRHWWQLGDGGRIEFGARAGRYFADSTIESYALAQPWLALRLRPDGWELAARVAVEYREYDAERVVDEGRERSSLGTCTVSADRRIGHGLWAGAFTGLSARNSDYDDRDYQRWQLGARLTWTFAAEE